MPPSNTPKKPTPVAAPAPARPPVPAAVQAGTGDPLADLTDRLKAEAARAKVTHLANYRAGVACLAAGRALAPEDESAFDAALAFMQINTDDVGRDTQTVRAVAALKQNLGETPEERAARGTQLLANLKASAADLDRLREALKKAEAEHRQKAHEELGFGSACVSLDRLVLVNPRLFAAEFPLSKPAVPQMHENPLPPPPPPPPPPTEHKVVHPLTGEMVTLSPERYAATVLAPAHENTHPGQLAAVDRLRAERAEAAADAETRRRMQDADRVNRDLAAKRAAIAAKAEGEKPAPAPAE